LNPISRNEHYSYSIYADAANADRFDESHFGGPIGELIVAEQERVLKQFLGDLRDLTVLDVGTGTGRAALAIAGWGAKVTGVDASIEMLRVAQKHAEDAGLKIAFLPGDAHSLDFSDQSFDDSVSLRMLMHTPDWRRCLAELCRVTRGRVVFDYPPLVSAGSLHVVIRRIARWAGRNVEAYHLIRTSAVRSVLAESGFQIAKIHRQFVLPIALHKLVGSRNFTRQVEKLLEAAGLQRLIGSPVTILAQRFVSGSTGEKAS